MATELAKAYVQIIPSAQGIQGSISSVLDGEASSAGASAGEKVASGLGSTIGKAIAALGIGKMIADSITNTGDFESAMAKVSTLFTGTGSQFDGLQQKILELSSAYGLGATTLAEAAYSAESAGVPVENLGAILESSARLATAGFTDIDTALSATAKTMNAYGMEGEAAISKVQNVLMQTQNLGITTVGELGAALANVTPTAAAAGVSFEQVGAALAQMTAAGVPTAQATTQLRSAIAELSKSGTKASDAFKAAAEGSKYAGQSFQEATANGMTMGEAFSMMQTYADETGVSMLDLWSSVEAGNAAMLIAGDVDTFNSNLEAMASEADNVGEAYSKMADTFNNSMSRLKESAKNFMTTLFTGGDVVASFEAMLGNLQEVLTRAGEMVLNGITGIFENLPGMLSGAMDLVSGLVDSIMGVDWGATFSTMITGVAGLLPVFLEKGGEIVSKLVAGISENGPQILTTISEAISNALGSVSEVLPKFLSTGSEIVQNLLNGLSQSAPGVAEAIGTILESIAAAITNAFPAISEGVATIVSAFDPLVSDITNAFTDVVSIITQAISDIVSGLAPYIPAITEMVTETTAQIPSIVDSFNGIVGTVTEAITSIVSALAPYVPSITEMVETTVSQLPNIINSFNGIVDTVSSAITSVVGAIAPYIPSITEMVETTVSKLPDIVNAFQGIVDKIPSIIDSIGEAVAKIGTAVTEVVSSVGDNVTKIVTAFSDLLSSLSGPIDSIASLVEKIGTAVSTVVESVGTNVSGIVEAFSGLFASLSGPIESVGSLIESIGTAIGTVVTAVGDCVAAINNSFANVLDSIKGVIDSIGDGAVKAGQGFSTLADAIIRLVNQTGFMDLAATLTKVANAVGRIADTGKKAGDAYANLEKLVSTLSRMGDTDYGTMADSLARVAGELYVITVYTPTLKDTKTNLDALGKVKLTELCTQLQNASRESDAFKTAVDNNTKAIVSQFETMITDTEATFSDYDWESIGTDLTGRIADGISSESGSVTGNVTTMVEAAAAQMNDYNWSAVGSSAIDSISSGMSSNNSIRDQATAMAGNMGEAFRSYGWSSLGSNIVSGIMAGINANAGSLTARMKQLAIAALRAAKDALGISSPSRVMRDQVGRWIPEGIALGIEQNSRLVSGAMEDLAASAAETDLSSTISAQGNFGTMAGNNVLAAEAEGGLIDRIISAVKTGMEEAEIALYMDGRKVSERVNELLGADITARRFA